MNFLNLHGLDQSEGRIVFGDTLHVVATVKNNTSRYASRVVNTADGEHHG